MLGHGRKIATILAADVVEYSRLMGADDEGTLSALNVRRAIFERHIREFEGREFGSVGDSLMAEFPSAVNAVRCAQAIQQAVAKENESLAPEQRMSLRIGLDLGDVIEENGALFGEGVNVAARLQSLAAPGGILISGAVHEHVKKKLQARLSYAGARHVKNIPDPVPAYEVLAVDKRRSLLETVTHYPHRWRIAATVALVALLAGALWYWRGALELPGQPATRAALSAEPSVAVLPFVNMSGDPDNEYFSDGISEELRNRLAKTGQFRVTGRTSSFAFKGKNDDLRTIGEKLGVESILEGSVRKQEDRIRVTAQLVSVRDGSPMWSERYDRQLKDVFEVQDEIAGEVVTALSRTLLVGKADAATAPASVFARPTSNLEAYNSYLRGEYLLRKRTAKDMEQALIEFQRAAALDPKFALAQVGIAETLALLISYGGRNIADVKPLAEAAIASALELDPHLAKAHAAKFLLLLQQGATLAESRPVIERALALNPNDALALHWLGSLLDATGRPSTEVLPVRERAYLIDPLAPVVVNNLAIELYRAGQQERARALAEELATLTPESNHSYDLRGGFAWTDGRIDECLRWNARAIKARPDIPEPYFDLGRAYEWLGDTEAAARQFERLLEMNPNDMQAVADLAVLRASTGDAPAAKRLLGEAMRRYPDDRDLRRAHAVYDYAVGSTQRALVTLRAVEPLLFRDTPELVFRFPYQIAPMAAFLVRETGDAAHAARIATAFYAFTDSWARPAEKCDPDRMRVQMAAAMEHRADVVRYLQRLLDSGCTLPAWLPAEPLFKPYVNDPVVAPLLTKNARRLAEWRRQLAAEGL